MSEGKVQASVLTQHLCSSWGPMWCCSCVGPWWGCFTRSSWRERWDRPSRTRYEACAFAWSWRWRNGSRSEPIPASTPLPTPAPHDFTFICLSCLLFFFVITITREEATQGVFTCQHCVYYCSWNKYNHSAVCTLSHSSQENVTIVYSSIKQHYVWNNMDFAHKNML